MFFSSLKRLIGLISVHESGDHITIEGLPGDTVQKSIYEIWNTHKIADNVFSSIDNSSVTFNKFFAVDVVYILQKIVSERKKGHNLRALNRAVELMLTNTWLKSTQMTHPDILHYDRLSELNVTMMPKQMEFFAIYNELVPKYNLNGYLLGADPGTGKTLMCIGLALCLGVDHLITICPKNAVERVWSGTYEERFHKTPKYWNTLMDRDLSRDDKYIIAHFDALDKLMVQLKRSGISGKIMIALDESHGLNEIVSERTGLFIDLCQYTRSNHVIWSSGTPIKAIGSEATPLFITIDPYFDEDAQRRFKAIYGKSAQSANDILSHRMGKVHYHVSKGDVVKVGLHHHTIQVKMDNGSEYTLESIKVRMVKYVKERVEHYQKNMKTYENTYNTILKYFESTLPKKTFTQSFVDNVIAKPVDKWSEYHKYQDYIKQIRKGFDPRSMRELSAFCNHYEKTVIMPALPKAMRDEFKDIRSIIKYYMLKVQGEALGKVLGQDRVRCHEDMLKGQWFQETTVNGQDGLVPITLSQIVDQAIKKTIFFTSYVPVVDAAAKTFRELGYKPILVYGATNNDLAQHISTFELDPNVNPLCATFASLSTAVPMVMANNTIMMNSPFRSYEYEQAMARTHRNGQDEEVHIWDVKLNTDNEPNISTRSHSIMAWSKQQVEEILGNKPLGPIGSMEQQGIDPETMVWYDELMEMDVALEDFAEYEGYTEDWSGHKENDEPVKPSWANW